MPEGAGGVPARRARRNDVSVAPRRRRLSSRSFPRLRSQPIQTSSPLVPEAAAMEKPETVAAAGGGPCRSLSGGSPPARARAAPRPRAGSRRARRASPTGARSAARGRCWRGSGLPASGRPLRSPTRRSEARDGDQRPQLGRHATGELELREAPRAQSRVTTRWRSATARSEAGQSPRSARRTTTTCERRPSTVRATGTARTARAVETDRAEIQRAPPRESSRGAATAGRGRGSRARARAVGAPFAIR